MPVDPFAPDPAEEPDKMWGIRSYDSPPDDPRPGHDVYDVHSKAPGTGLNGTAYRTW